MATECNLPISSTRIGRYAVPDCRRSIGQLRIGSSQSRYVRTIHHPFPRTGEVSIDNLCVGKWPGPQSFTLSVEAGAVVSPVRFEGQSYGLRVLLCQRVPAGRRVPSTRPGSVRCGKVTQRPACGGDDNASRVCDMQNRARRPGQVILFERKWVSFGERRRDAACLRQTTGGSITPK